MSKSWVERLRGRLGKGRARGRRRPVGWLSRIDGVEKPALLVGLGMVLYRAWKLGEPGAQPGSRWRRTFRRWRQQLEQSLGRIRAEAAGSTDSGSAQEKVPDGAAGAAQRGQREHDPRLGHPPP
jgi:hypothetical protein